ncbi:RDD family protein [Paucibacter sp. M5-1]|uniref:RDD family protein n=1 Tax=Paucibacter sp. M5-1 TaxID=3015998 RepID=UPI0022B8F933|nr:RDD family protein [Paucibacter sp. M5-1]MCZ7882467.1 RDD family protein [Paucibacter sp. M5-1]
MATPWEHSVATTTDHENPFASPLTMVQKPAQELPPGFKPPPSRKPRPSAPPPPPATLGRRALALLVDALALIGLSAPLLWLAYREGFVGRLDDVRPASLLINWALPALYFIGFWAWQGTTPGKLLAGLLVVDARSGARPTPGRCALRWLGYLLSALPLGLGFAWAALDGERRCWHDRMAGTRVVLRRPRSEADSGSGYLAAHWQGEHSLARSFWINNVLLSLPIGLALTGLMTWISLKGEALQAGSIAMLIGWPLILAFDTWAIVGAWRAAHAYRRIDGSALWANLARLSLVLSALQMVVSTLFGFLPQAGEYWQMARGSDPIGQASFKLSADGRTLRLDGPIGMGDATRLQKLLAGTAQPVRLFELASPGGRVYEAERMVEQVRKTGAATRAVGGCESACTLVFLAGQQRQLMPGARLGFHRASSGSYNPVFDEVANQELAATYREMGLPEPLIQRTLRTPADSMWYPASDELILHALIEAPPQTLDVVLPSDPATSTEQDYLDALGANPAWHLLGARYPELLPAAAARMRAAHLAQPGNADEPQNAALRVLAERLPGLLMEVSPELRRRYLAVLKAQLRTARAAGPAICQALLGGQLELRRAMPAELRAQETRWLGAAAEAAAPRWLPKAPSALELEVVRRTLGGHAPGLLGRVWVEDGGARAPSCDAVLRTLDQAAALPVAQRELAERLLLQRL